MTRVFENRLPPRIADAITNYVRGRERGRPVPIAKILLTTRYAIPNLALSNAELSDLITEHLLAEGCEIDFEIGCLETGGLRRV